MLLHPRDLKRPLVEQTATSELYFVLRPIGAQLLHMSQKLPHPLDAAVHDVDVRLETVASSTKRNRRAFSATPVGSPVARHFSSRRKGTQRQATRPRSQVRGPGAAVSQSMNATGTPDRKTVFCGKSSL